VPSDPPDSHLLPAGHLRTDGAAIVTEAGVPVRLAGVNWYGMEGEWTVPGGLDVRTIDQVCATVVDLGFNHIRLPYCDSLVRDNPRVDRGLAAMPALRGRRALDVMDEVIAGASRHGLKVILDSHRSEPGWSAQGNGLWYSRRYPASVWRDALVSLAGRYAGTDAVIGIDLRNEPGSPPVVEDEWPRNGGAVWGEPDSRLTRHPRDWARAAEAAGNAVLARNPNLLIVVEGVRGDPAGPIVDGSPHLYWPGGNLTGVGRAGGRRGRGRPLSLGVANRLVYSAHDYGPDMHPALPWCRAGTTAPTPDACRSVWEQTWGFIARRGIAPIYVGEFGTPNGLWPSQPARTRDYGDRRATDAQVLWFRHLAGYIAELGAGWAYWPLNGTNSPGGGRDPTQVEGYGLLGPDWVEPANPTVLARLRPIQGTQAPGATGD